MIIPKIDLSTYHYELPEYRIAKYPLSDRDSSKLLVFNEGSIKETIFNNIIGEIPTNSTLIFNNTKVIPARLLFQKDTGAQIEIFLLQPIAPSTVISETLASTNAVVWQCMIGNSKRWKNGTALQRSIEINGENLIVEASRLDNSNEVKISWDNHQVRFVDIVESAGQVPLPPYLNRKAEASDKERYQTVYSKNEGAVAAPTAGLHFTQPILEALSEKGVCEEYLTLHVSAGTFQPIKVDDVTQHPMHCEQIMVNKQTIEKVVNSEKVIAVGTTSMRTLESLYWYGIKLITESTDKLFIDKLYPYQQHGSLPTRKEVFQVILDYMNKSELESLFGETEIFIFPSYQFRVCDGLITNFHQPGSTLILLIAAFIGKNWQKVYKYALSNNFRFLSYGDSSLLWGAPINH
jgi:S-adenosylmethionine:tRNA ribosyltransferase-isomerase